MCHTLCVDCVIVATENHTQTRIHSCAHVLALDLCACVCVNMLTIRFSFAAFLQHNVIVMLCTTTTYYIAAVSGLLYFGKFVYCGFGSACARFCVCMCVCQCATWMKRFRTVSIVWPIRLRLHAVCCTIFCQFTGDVTSNVFCAMKPCYFALSLSHSLPIHFSVFLVNDHPTIFILNGSLSCWYFSWQQKSGERKV